MHIPKKNQQGFTLIELLLYMAIATIVVTGVTILFVLVIGARVRTQTIGEVEGQGAFVVQQIGLSGRNAASINSPAPGTTDSTLSLQVNDSTKSPTVYSLSNGVLYVTEGSGQPIALTSPSITISDLSFTNLSTSGTPSEALRMSFTASYVNNIGRNEYDYSRTFTDSFSLR